MEPVQRLRLIASDLGRHAALIEPGRIVVVRLPALEVVSEVPLALTDLHGVGLLSDGRLVMITGGQLVTYVDGGGWAPVAAYGRRAGAALVATSGGLVVTTVGATAMVTDLNASVPRTRPIPIRGPVRQATMLADGRIAFVLEDALEIWNLEAVTPARRIRVRPSGRLQLGGVTAQVWCIHADRPQWIDVLPTSGTAYRVGVGEDIAVAHGSPDGVRVCIVRASTGRAGVIAIEHDPTKREPDTSIDVVPLGAEPPLEDVAWVASTGMILTCSPDRVLQLSTPGAPESGLPPPSTTVTAAAVHTVVSEPEITPPLEDRISAHDRLVAWRQRIGAERAAAEGQPAESYDPQETPRAYDDWRRELVAAVRRRIIAGGSAHLDVPTPVEEVAHRLEVSGEILALAYGAHLAGIDGVPPVELARIDGVEWSEALGAGRLASLGALVWSRSRVRLAPELRAMFDERGALRGTVVPAPVIPAGVGSHAGLALDATSPQCLAVVANPARLDLVAAALPGHTRALLVPNASGLRWPRRLLLEATARDLTPVLPWAELADRLGALPARAIVVVATDAEAAALGLWFAPAPVSASESTSPLTGPSEHPGSSLPP